MSINKTAELQAIQELVEKGEHKPVVDVCYPLDKMREAHAYVDTGRKRGNVVITVDHEPDAAAASSGARMSDHSG